MNDKSHVDFGQAIADDVLAKRFLLRDAPTVRAGVFSQGRPISFTRLASLRPQPGRSLTPQPEEAFVFQMPLITSPDPGIRYSSGDLDTSGSSGPGSCYLLDLRSSPSRRLDMPFDTMRLYLAQSAIDEFTDQKRRRRIGGLLQPNLGASDPVLFRLSQTLQAVLQQPDPTSALFVDYLALAFCEHVVTRYGRADPAIRPRRAGLAPWQMRRIEDFFAAHLHGNPSIADLARQCGLSTSYFGEAFRQTTGSTPHQWLLKRRIERAKSLLRETDASLASIASECGFFDQSHFSRVFSRLEGCGPKTGANGTDSAGYALTSLSTLERQPEFRGRTTHRIALALATQTTPPVFDTAHDLSIESLFYPRSVWHQPVLFPHIDSSMPPPLVTR